MIFVIEQELSCEKRLILTVTCIASIYVTDPDQLVLTEAIRSSCTGFFLLRAVVDPGFLVRGFIFIQAWGLALLNADIFSYFLKYNMEIK